MTRDIGELLIFSSVTFTPRLSMVTLYARLRLWMGMVGTVCGPCLELWVTSCHIYHQGSSVWP